MKKALTTSFLVKFVLITILLILLVPTVANQWDLLSSNLDCPGTCRMDSCEAGEQRFTGYCRKGGVMDRSQICCVDPTQINVGTNASSNDSGSSSTGNGAAQNGDGSNGQDGQNGQNGPSEEEFVAPGIEVRIGNARAISVGSSEVLGLNTRSLISVWGYGTDAQTCTVVVVDEAGDYATSSMAWDLSRQPCTDPSVSSQESSRANILEQNLMPTEAGNYRLLIALYDDSRNRISERVITLMVFDRREI